MFLFLLGAAIVNFLWATLAWIGLSIAIDPNPRYWVIYGTTYFLFTLPVGILVRAVRSR